MPKRPLIQKEITDLENMFFKRSDDQQFLKDLMGELSVRKTKRAQELLRKVVQANEIIAQKSTLLIDTREVVHENLPIAADTTIGISISPISETMTVSTAANRPAIEHVSICNNPEDILSAWTAMEVLSPPSFRNPQDLAGGERGRIAYINNGHCLGRMAARRVDLSNGFITKSFSAV
ncbi:hypothetical protein WJT86_12160 [Microvirga sp. W0021]|uniref:Uncharacterized protein n=1 Tax=Hohaiivirga grylli TaxID=3133970 RepID=A0ABV0BNQ9_9HYPH